MYRLRKDGDHATLFGSQGIGTWGIHLSYGVVLALFDGRRTVLDVARLTRHMAPFVDESDALAVASHHIKLLAGHFTKTKEEQKGEHAARGIYPSESPLLLKQEYDEKFAGRAYRHVEYDPREFLPKDATEISDGPYGGGHLRSPHEINWHLTSTCSVDCKYCYLLRRRIHPLPKSKALALVDEIAEADVLALNLLGGDVLLYPHLVDVIEAMRGHRFLPIEISTKSFLSKKLAAELARASDMISALQFSIDADDEHIAQYLVGVPNYPARIFASIDNALEAGLDVAAKMVVTPHNVYTVPRLYRTLRKRGVSQIRVAAYGRSGFHHTDDLFLDDDCYAWWEQEQKKLQEEFADESIRIQNGGPQVTPQSVQARQEAWASRSACAAGRTMMMICTDGKVIPCEQMPETEEYFCGDVTRESVLEIWHGDRLKELTYGMPRDKFRGQPCYDCSQREECLGNNGICIRDLAVHYGSIYLPPPNCPRHDLPFVRIH
jgi:radical SAM protein with 4Fe4S-binding SPASM domain